MDSTQDTIPTEKRANKRTLVIVSVAVILAVIVIVAVILLKTNGSQIIQSLSQEVSTDDPIDVALDFYGPWLKAVKSTSTNPYQEGLAENKILSKELRARLMSTEGRSETDIDPVLCQTTIPERATGRIVSEQESEARVLVKAKEKELTAQSVFTLKRLNDGWYIDAIECELGEFELPREFTFEKEGHLLKSVPPPYDPQYWHLVFEENGELGHVVPLFFNATSTCKSTDGSENVCNTDQFVEATKVHVYAQMTELGAEVQRLEFLE